MARQLKIKYLLIICIFANVLSGCSKDSPDLPQIIEEGTSIPEEDPNKPVEEEKPAYEKAGKIEIFDRTLINDGYLMVNDAGNKRAYLMNYDLDILFEWNLSFGIGNDVTLLPDGNILALLRDDNASINFGGYGGIIHILDKNSNILWEFNHSTENYNLHHDIEMLPNGNIIGIVWEKIPEAEAKNNGVLINGTDVFPEAIIEIDPKTNEIVWEWRSWDHIIQDAFPEKDKFGIIAEHPELIDVNYVEEANGDIMHANGLSYDATKDLIFLSVNFFNEVWVIDHSTSTQEARSSSGGKFNKGGDLVYRFGNPEAYQNPQGSKMFDRNHFPNLLDGDDTGAMLIFNNNITARHSIVYELELPETYDLRANQQNELKILWSFTSPDLFAPKVSGAVRLPNGNTLITEGDHGGWEVTENGDVVWKFMGDGFYWRIYHYPENSPLINFLKP